MRSNVVFGRRRWETCRLISGEDSGIAMYLAEKTVGSDVIGGEDGIGGSTSIGHVYLLNPDITY